MRVRKASDRLRLLTALAGACCYPACFLLTFGSALGRYLHDSQSLSVVLGLMAHGRAGQACLIHANRSKAAAEAEAADLALRCAETDEERAKREAAKRRCPGGCGFLVNWHDSHCCRMCKSRNGEHGPHCLQRMADPPDKRYDVRSLVLLGCSHEAADGSVLNGKLAFEAKWRVFSVHGTEDEEAELMSTQQFHATHRDGGHRLRLIGDAGHTFSGKVPTVASVVNDWFEGARRLVSSDLGAALDGSTGRMLLASTGSSSGDVNLSGTRPNARMLGSAGMVWLVEELKSDSTVVSLDLSCNNIRASGGAPLAAALESNTTLTALDLHSNALLSGARAFGLMLKRNSTLCRLNLRTNGIGAPGAAAVAEALQLESCSLTSLNLRDNAVMAVGAAALAAALKTNTSLLELDLSENLVKEGGAAAIGEALASANATLASLNMRYNGLRSGTLALSKALVTNRGLTELDLRQNDIGALEVRALAKAVVDSNTTLTSLDLGFEDAQGTNARGVGREAPSSLAKKRAQDLAASLAETLKAIGKTLSTNGGQAVASLGEVEAAEAAASRAAVVEEELALWPDADVPSDIGASDDEDEVEKELDVLEVD